MDLAKQILDECVTRQEALARLDGLKEEAEKEFFGEKKSDPGEEMKVYDEASREIAKVPELVVYVAQTLPVDSQGRLGKKAREVFSKDLFLDFKVDPSLWAGAALAWQGQYKDYSLKTKFEAKKEEVWQIIQKSVL